MTDSYWKLLWDSTLRITPILSVVILTIFSVKFESSLPTSTFQDGPGHVLIHASTPFVKSSNSSSDLFQSENPVPFKRGLLEISTNSSVIKGYRSRSIYILDNGIRHHIPDWTTFISLGFTTNSITSKPDSEVEAIPLGDPVQGIDAQYDKDENGNVIRERCPCEPRNRRRSGNTTASIASHLCILNNTFHRDIFAEDGYFTQPALDAAISSEGLTTKILSVKPIGRFVEFAREGCFALVNVTTLLDLPIERRFSCPGICSPFPLVQVPVEWLTAILVQGRDLNLFNNGTAASCSATFSQLFGHQFYRHILSLNERNESSTESTAEEASSVGNHNKKRRSSYASLLMLLLAQRRVEECRERDQWIHASRPIASSPLSDTNSSHYSNSSSIMKTKEYIVGNMTTNNNNKADNVTYPTEHIFMRSARRLESQEPLASSHRRNHSHHHQLHQHEHLHELLHAGAYQRRKVRGLFIWIGSTSKLWLAEAQASVLQSAPFDGDEADVGWIASEDVYPCRIGTTVCEDLTVNLAYHAGMPTSRLNNAPPGWSCAQRRPLRALAHTLSLFDPEFVFLGDDDTYINYRVLVDNYLPFLRSRYMAKTGLEVGGGGEAMAHGVLGELTHGKKVTVRGFFQGGSGYLIGKGTIEALSSFLAPGIPARAEKYLAKYMQDQLSVSKDAVRISNSTGCPGCAVFSENGQYESKLQVRLVDICSNLMAQERTCYHSDHSMSRCLIHGSYSTPFDANCLTGFMVPGADIPQGLPIRMCMYATVCDIERHLTCHRWMPNLTDSSKVVMVYPDRPDYY